MEEVKTIKEIETNSGSVFMLVQGLDSLLVLGSLYLYNIELFLETCIFPNIDQPEGLVIRDSSSACYNIAKDVSQLEAITTSVLKVCEKISN